MTLIIQNIKIKGNVNLPSSTLITLTKMKLLFPFKSKLLKPCKKLIRSIKFRLHKPIFIKRVLQFRRPKHNKVKKPSHKRRLPSIRSVLHALRLRSKEMDRVEEIKSFSDAGFHHRAPYPSPITPAYIRLSRVSRKEDVSPDENELEDACRSFENYLVEMIVEEGKMRDLVDVEELLHCWKNLRSPVFVDLVCRFYGELCRDLFSNSCENDH